MVQYRVINKFQGEEFDRHEYNIHVENTERGTKYSLVRSNAEHWAESFRNTTACAIIDDGDGYIMSKHFKKEMDYAITAEFLILLVFINKTDNFSLFEGIIEQYEVQKVYHI